MYCNSFFNDILRHLVLNGGEAKNFITPAAIQITNVSFGEEIADSNGRSVVKLSFASLSPSDDEDEDAKDDEEDGPGLTTVTTVLCSLTPGKVVFCLPLPQAVSLTFCRLNKWRWMSL